jgi:hypothetical protein
MWCGVVFFLGGCLGGYEYSNIIIERSHLIGNRAVYGGAVFGQLYTTLNISNSEIYQNSGVRSVFRASTSLSSD